jgi:hypothetical protein
MSEKKDTSPMVQSRRIKRQIRIQETNHSSSSLFDTTVEYPSNDLPEWFAPLQAIVEDETFTDLRINLGGRVQYHVTLVEETK